MKKQTKIIVSDALQELRSSTSEAEVRSGLHGLLRTYGSKNWRLEHQLSTGFADMVNFPARIIIEIKRPRTANPSAKSSTGETQLEQLTRYVAGIVDQSSRGRRIKESDDWRAFLTDGLTWWGFQWHEGTLALVPMPYVQGTSFHFDLESIGNFVNTHLKRTTPGKDIPPDDITSKLINPFLETLTDLQRKAESEVFYQTKFGLWRKVLQGSGIAPADSSPLNQSYVFLRHSLIVALARILIACLRDSSAHAGILVANTLEGFQGWISEDPQGCDLLVRIGETVRQYDWRGSTKDVLKEVYHGLIDPEHRKEFGEFYTPDNLARDMICRVLDDVWCDDAIVRADKVISGSNGVSTSHLGVLDPSCGSGTFLYHAARRILDRISCHHLSLRAKSPHIVSRLVHGIDVHPVAVEMAKATLAMALPETIGGTPKLRIALADSMQTQVGPVFEKLGLYISTPANASFYIPNEIVAHQNSGPLVEAAVEAAVRRSKPSLDPTDYTVLLIEKVEELAESLTPIVENESNHVWVWHMENAIEFARISRDKVGRLIGNPPWLVRNETPQGSRKNDIKRLGNELGLVERLRGSSAKGDLAAIFTARVTDLYLGDTERLNGFAWVLPGSALISQTWNRWRNGFRSGTYNVQNDLAWNLNEVEPPIFRHAPNGTCVVFGRKILGEPEEPLRVMAWNGKFELAEVGELTTPKFGVSPYLESVERGAFYSPEPLFLVDRITEVSADLVSVCTKPGSPKKAGGRWFQAEFKDVVLERDVLLPVYRSTDLKAFHTNSSAYLILAINEDRTELLNPKWCGEQFPRLYSYWLDAEEKYLARRGASSSESLFENLDYRRYISKQLKASPSSKPLKVIYNKSGNTVRAATIKPSEIAGQTLYWLMAASVDEAMYLCGILNAPCMQQVWRKSRTSNHDFHKSIFRYTAIPTFMPGNFVHEHIAQVAKALSTSSSVDPVTLEGLNEPVQELFIEELERFAA